MSRADRDQVIDALTPIGAGANSSSATAGRGKTTLAIDTIINQRAGFCFMWRQATFDRRAIYQTLNVGAGYTTIIYWRRPRIPHRCNFGAVFGTAMAIPGQRTACPDHL